MIFNMVGGGGGSSSVENKCYAVPQVVFDYNKSPKFIYTLTFAKAGEYDMNIDIFGALKGATATLYKDYAFPQKITQPTLNITGGEYAIKDAEYTPGSSNALFPAFHIKANQDNAQFTMKFDTPFSNPGSGSWIITLQTFAYIWGNPELSPTFTATLATAAA